MTQNFPFRLKVAVAVPWFLLLLLATSFGETSQNVRYRRLKQLPVGVESYAQAKDLVVKLIRARPERAFEYFRTGVSKIKKPSLEEGMFKSASRVVMRSKLTGGEKRKLLNQFRQYLDPYTPQFPLPTPEPQ